MAKYTFDVKLFATVHVDAPNETAARAAIDDAVAGLVEGNRWRDKGTDLFINSASLDGEADLMQIDGEDHDG